MRVMFFKKEKRLNNCYQQLLRRISSDVIYILKRINSMSQSEEKFKITKGEPI